MSDILASMSVVLGADISEFKAAMASAKAELKGLVQFGEGMKDVGESMTKYLTLPIALAGVEAVRAFDKQALAVAQVENGLRSTGNVAKLTSEQLQELASQIQKKSVYGDEEVLQKVTTQLLTFSNISGDVFKRTQQAAVDLSAKLGQDLQTSAIQLGKALNDPTQSLGALRRAGISFSNDQIALIHHLQATNQLGKAQTIILSEMERQYGGTAEAAAKAGTGGLKQLSNQFGDLLEDFGKIIVEGIQPLIHGLSDLIAYFQELSPGTKGFIVAALAVVAAAGPVLFVVGGLIVALPALTAAFAVLTGPIALATAAAAALGIGLATALSGSHAATAEFKDQKGSVEALTNAVNPLLDRYDQLKAKTTLTKAEQTELREIVQKVGEQIPTTITAFDSYGKALDINSDAARNFVKAQQEILAVKNREALTEQRAEYARLTQQIDGATNALNKFNDKGQLVKAVFDESGGGFEALSGKEITELQNRLAGLREARRGVGGLIDELKGIKPAAEDGAAGGNKLADTFDKKAAAAAKKLADELAKLANELRTNTILADNLPAFFKGEGGYDAAAERIKILTNGLKKLVEDGLNPASAAFQKYLKELLTLSQAPDAKLADSPIAPRVVGVQSTIAALPPTFLSKLKEHVKETPQVYADFEIAQKKFNENTAALVDAFPSEAFTAIFSAIGGAIGSGTDVFKAAADALLKVLADFGAKYGAQLILMGIADVASGVFAAKGVAEIAAGGALIVGSAALGGAVGGAGGGSNSGGGGANFTPRAAATFTPTTAPTAAVNTGPTTITHNVIITANGRDLRGTLAIEQDRLGRVLGVSG
ncbi:MAG: hypothetical protein NVSMB30_27140 [Hymenobacter sp.]